MLARITINLISAYQLYSRIWLVPSCRFRPSCSQYAKEALEKYGFLQGALKATQRLLRCHPLSRRAGDDPLI